MKPQDYEQLYDALRQKNDFLINSPSEYRNGHYFPYSYGAIKKATPQSIWLEIGELSNGFDVLFEKMRIFGNKAVIVKDYVKPESMSGKKYAIYQMHPISREFKLFFRTSLIVKARNLMAAS